MTNHSNMLYIHSMKKCFWFLMLFFSKQLYAQSYIPLHLDTSCFWVNDARFYSGNSGSSVYCNFEVTSFVQKDTMVNGKQYHKILSYASSPLSADPNWAIASCNTVFKRFQVSFIREDSAQQKIFLLDFSISASIEKEINFLKNSGDSITMVQNGAKGLIDSIAVVNYNGINRKTLFGFYTSNLYQTKWIEGIGSNRNFPLIGFGEWGIPAYILKCYSKGGLTLYGDSLQPCIKKTMDALVINDVAKLNVNISCNKNFITINNTENKQLQMQLFDVMGHRLMNQTIASNLSKIECNCSNGIYFIKVFDQAKVVTQKIIIEND
jgi:hypothetical protein